MRTNRHRSTGSRLRRLGVLMLACASIVLVTVTASGQTSGGAISIDPNAQLVNNQFVAVAVSGMPTDNFVRVRQCPKAATVPAQCAQDSPTGTNPADSRVVATDSSGGGSTSFIVAAGKVTDMNGNEFACDVNDPCELVVFQLGPSGHDLGFSTATVGAITYGASTVQCPSQRRQVRVAGSGATSPAADVIEWQSEVCAAPYKLNVSYSVTNSPNGKQAFIQALTDADFAVSTIPLTTDEVGQLTTAKREAVQIPIAAGSLSFIYNYWVQNLCNGNQTADLVTTLRLSPRAIIWILTGRIGNMDDPVIAADNQPLIDAVHTKDCQPSTTALPSQRIDPVGRADNSGATWTLSSWADAVDKKAWQTFPDGTSAGAGFATGPTTIFPAGNGVDLRTGNGAVASDVRTAGGTTLGAPTAAWFGYVDTSQSRMVGLPTIAVKNPAGSYLQPTTNAVEGGIAASRLNADGTVTPNYTPTDANAYPIPVISYLIVDKARLNTAKAQAMRTFATYAISKGQAAAVDRGYVPLTDEMSKSGGANAALISSPPVTKNKGSGGSGSGTGSTGSVPGSGSGSSAGSGAGSGATSGSSDPSSSSLPVAPGLDNATKNLLTSAADTTVAASSSASSGPVKLSPSSEALGPAGGPAGIVRGVAVYFGVPILVVLGLFCLIVGSFPRLLQLVGPYLPERLRWVTA